MFVKSRKIVIFRHFLSKLLQLQLSIIKENTEGNEQSVISG